MIADDQQLWRILFAERYPHYNQVTGLLLNDTEIQQLHKNRIYNSLSKTEREKYCYNNRNNENNLPTIKNYKKLFKILYINHFVTAHCYDYKINAKFK